MGLEAEIRARMSLDSSGVKAGITSANSHVDGFKSSLGGLSRSLTKAFGAAAIAGFAAKFTKDAIEMAIRTKEVADQAGLTVEQLQAIYSESMQVTGGFKAAETGLVTFRAAQQEALEGNEAQIKAFGRLGISLEDIANKSTPELLEAVAKGYKAVGDFGALVDLFGRKNAGKLEEALIALADSGFGGLEKKAKDAGMVLGDEFSARLDQVGDSMDRLKLKAQVLWDKLLIGAFNTLRKLEAWRKGMVAYGASFLADMWDPSVALSPSKVINAVQNAEQAGREAQSKELKKQKNDDKIFLQEREHQQQKAQERETALRKAKIGEIYAAEAEEAKKAEDKKKDEAAKAAEKKLAADQKAAEKMAEKQAAESGVSITELRGSGSKQFQQRFDSLRQIGANVLGSGVIRPSAVDREAEIAEATKRTAMATEKIAAVATRPAVSQVAPVGATF